MTWSFSHSSKCFTSAFGTLFFWRNPNRIAFAFVYPNFLSQLSTLKYCFRHVLFSARDYFKLPKFGLFLPWKDFEQLHQFFLCWNSTQYVLLIFGETQLYPVSEEDPLHNHSSHTYRTIIDRREMCRVVPDPLDVNRSKSELNHTSCPKGTVQKMANKKCCFLH